MSQSSEYPSDLLLLDLLLSYFFALSYSLDYLFISSSFFYLLSSVFFGGADFMGAGFYLPCLFDTTTSSYISIGYAAITGLDSIIFPSLIFFVTATSLFGLSSFLPFAEPSESDKLGCS